MISQDALRLAKTAANELRRRGEQDQARAIEALVEAARPETIPALDLHTSSEAENIGALPDPSEQIRSMLSFIGVIKDAPPRLSEEVDETLYG